MEKKIVIIGAGPTGLGAAYRLKERGYKNFHMYERSDPLGGSAGALPEMHRRIAAPRSPRFRLALGLRCGHTTQSLADDDVFLGEGVCPSQRPHRDVARGPWTDAGKRDESVHCRFGIGAGLEGQAALNRFRERDD